MKLWYAGFRSEVVTVLEAWEGNRTRYRHEPKQGRTARFAATCWRNAKHHDDTLAESKHSKPLVAARIEDVPVDAPVIAVVGGFNEEQFTNAKRFHDAIRAQRNPRRLWVS